MAYDLTARLRLVDNLSSPMRRATSYMSRMQSVADRTASSTRSLGNAVTGIAAGIGVTAALAGGFNMVKSSIDGAFSRIDTMESFDRALTVLTGSAERTQAALVATRDAVTGTAYGLDVAAKGVQDFVTRGMEVEKATATMQAWGDAVAFYGNGSNEQLASVSDALAKMYSAGKVSMDQMNRLFDAGIDGVGMYAKAVGMDVKAAQKALSSGKVSMAEFIDVVNTAMMEGTNGVVKIAGAAKEAGASWGATFDNMRAAVTRGVTDIIQTTDKLLTDNGLPDMRAMIANVGKVFESGLKKAATFIEPLASKVKSFYNAIKPAMPMLKSFGVALGIAFTTVLVGVKSFGLLAGAIAVITSPVGLVIGAITGLILGFQALYKNIESFRSVIDGMVAGVKALFAAFSGDTSGAVNILEKAGFGPEQIQKVLDFVSNVKNAIGAMKDWIVAKFNEIKPGIMSLVDTFSNIKEVISNVLSSLWAYVGPVLSALGNAFLILADFAVMAFNNVIAPTVQFIWSLFQTLWTIVGPILELLGAALVLAWEGLKIAYETIIKPVAAYLMGEFKAAMEGMQPILEVIGFGFEFLADKIRSAVDWIKELAGKVSSFKPPEWLSKVGGTVASFLSGGRAPKADGSHFHGLDRVPYDGYVATLHKGERVQTKAEVDAEGSGGGRNVNVSFAGANFNIRQESDIQKVAQELAKYIESEGAQMA